MAGTTRYWSVSYGSCRLGQMWLAVTWRADAGKADHTVHLRRDLDDVDNRASLIELARHAAMGDVVTVVLYESEEVRLAGSKGWIENDALSAAGRAVAVAEVDCQPAQQLAELLG